MLRNLLKDNLTHFLWTKLQSLLGDSPALVEMRSELARVREADQTIQKDLQAELEKTREERLQWMAKESSVRKELQDAQERSKDLLEQVVRLTHQQRQAKQSLINEQFKAITSPLERNRYEIELAEARGKAKRAEERAQRSEERLAQMQKLEEEAARAKTLEQELCWNKEQAEKSREALTAALERVKYLETRITELEQAAAPRTKVSYKKPALRKASAGQAQAFRAAAPELSSHPGAEQ
jgi:chromosome segregation ATPase